MTRHYGAIEIFNREVVGAGEFFAGTQEFKIVAWIKVDFAAAFTHREAPPIAARNIRGSGRRFVKANDVTAIHITGNGGDGNRDIIAALVNGQGCKRFQYRRIIDALDGYINSGAICVGTEEILGDVGKCCLGLLAGIEAVVLTS